MALTLDQNITGTSSTGTVIGTVVSTSGNELWALQIAYDGNANTIASVTQSGQTWNKVLGSSTTTVDVDLWATYVTTAKTGTITVVSTNKPARMLINALTFTNAKGVLGTDSFGGSTVGTLASGSIRMGTVTTTGVNSQVIGLFAHANSVSAYQILNTSGVNGTYNDATNFRFYVALNNTGLTASPSSVVIGGTMNGASSDVYYVAEVLPSTAIGTNLIQSAGTSNLAATSTSASWTGATTTGNMVVVGVNISNATTLGTVSTVTDTQGNTYTKVASGTISEATSVLDTQIWYAPNIVGGAGSVTVNHVADNCSMYVREYSGKYNFFDVAGTATGSSTTPNSGTTAAVTQNNELIIVATGDDLGATQTYASAGKYGDMVGTTATLTGVCMQDNIVNTGGAQTGTLTLGGAANWVSLTATFGRIANPRYTPQGMGGM